jgi:hypothetical protein
LENTIEKVNTLETSLASPTESLHLCENDVKHAEVIDLLRAIRHSQRSKEDVLWNIDSHVDNTQNDLFNTKLLVQSIRFAQEEQKNDNIEFALKTGQTLDLIYRGLQKVYCKQDSTFSKIQKVNTTVLSEFGKVFNELSLHYYRVEELSQTVDIQTTELEEAVKPLLESVKRMTEVSSNALRNSTYLRSIPFEVQLRLDNWVQDMNRAQEVLRMSASGSVQAVDSTSAVVNQATQLVSALRDLLGMGNTIHSDLTRANAISSLQREYLMELTGVITEQASVNKSTSLFLKVTVGISAVLATTFGFLVAFRPYLLSRGSKGLNKSKMRRKHEQYR